METSNLQYNRYPSAPGSHLRAAARKPATLRDIAAAAGVGISAVSHVVNGARTGSRVSEAKRKLIIETADAMHYHPNAMARSLTRRSTGNIGVVFGAPMQMIGQPHVASFLEGVVEGVGHIGCQLVVFTTSWAEAHRSAGAFCHGRADGLIVYGPPNGSNVIAGIREWGIPVVAVELWDDRSDCPRVMCDDRAALRIGIDHLQSLGHCSITFLSTSSTRYKSPFDATEVRGAMAERGVKYARYSELPDCCGEFDRREHLCSLFTSEDRPTALITESCELARLAIGVAGEIGVDVPGDLSILAIDSYMPLSVAERREWCMPGPMRERPLDSYAAAHITMVRRPVRSMGRAAVSLLSAEIMHNGGVPVAERPPSQINTVLTPELVVGSSTGPMAQ